MNNNWFEIKNPNIDEAVINKQIQSRLEAHKQEAGPPPETVAQNLWQEMIGSTANTQQYPGLLQWQDCDIVPRNYVIDWQIPLLGPINSFIRRIINNEIQRFLNASLERQSFFNRQLLQRLNYLTEENQALRRELEQLRNQPE